jgi:signal transduction histidine kinase
VELVVTDRGFQVRDRGCGIGGDSLSQLGTPFFTTKPHGTGLGLSTVRKIVDAHGAHLRVESQPGMGSTFSIEWMEHSA